MRVAFASMASKTGCKSPGEPEITRSTSDVAVCCSSASASFFFRSALAARRRSTRVLAFVVFERRLVMRLRLFAPLRDKVTSSARLVDLCWLLQTSFDHLVGAGEHAGRHLHAQRLRGLEVDHQF